MPPHRSPALSIIVPLLNEAAELEPLLSNLALQEGVEFELLLCDGGSTDGSDSRAAELAVQSPFPVRLLTCPRGRGRQMNTGARAARGELLLFLHADSRFFSGTALARAVRAFTRRPDAPLPAAGRFGLRFRTSEPAAPSLAYYFHEAKARLPHAECIRGDQGFLFFRDNFAAVGGFDERLPFLEDVRMALAIEAAGGEWVLLTAEIGTSARRFETEGFLQRQILNAIIINSLVTGWEEFFHDLPGLYRRHDKTGRLQLHPIFVGIRNLLMRMPAKRRRTFWLATGRHVAQNCWQLFFWLDARSAYRRSLPPGAVPLRWTRRFHRLLAPPLASGVATALTAAGVWLWHRCMLVICRCIERP